MRSGVPAFTRGERCRLWCRRTARPYRPGGRRHVGGRGCGRTAGGESSAGLIEGVGKGDRPTAGRLGAEPDLVKAAVSAVAGRGSRVVVLVVGVVFVTAGLMVS